MMDGYLSLRRPRQFLIPDFVPTAAYVGIPKKDVDSGMRSEVILPKSVSRTTNISRSSTMTLTFKSLSKNGKNAFYSGAATVLRFALSAFPSKNAPQSFDVADGVFAGAKQPKVKMTAEERKTARAAQPKPTLAERIAKREAQLAKDKAKLAAAGTEM